MAGVSDHLEAIKAAYRDDPDDGDRLIDDLAAWCIDIERELDAWVTGSAAAVAQLMDAHARASAGRRFSRSFRLSKLP